MLIQDLEMREKITAMTEEQRGKLLRKRYSPNVHPRSVIMVIPVATWKAAVRSEFPGAKPAERAAVARKGPDSPFLLSIKTTRCAR